jgi:tetrapyrrole methylase family protein/MazG family protein
MVKIIAEGNNGTYTMKQLLEIMAALRSPGGCPWDIEQTHKSIRNDALEEVYEVVDAIDNDDAAALCEELGDMLLQVVFHSHISEENGEFTFEDVVDGICKKLVLRHPHVFGEEQIDSASAVLDRWDAIKKDEKHQQTHTETLKSVPKAFPALMRAAKVQKRAKKAGLDLGDALSNGSLEENLSELYAAVETDDAEEMKKAYGKVLFCMSGLQNTLKINAEEALATATDCFIEEFEQAELSGELNKHL